ncbi:MAG: diheme cytochrome c-553 [Chitinophagaceae bacterium]|nr:diheme cytochrome c-553 [Chitinophagaceae bacterium]
MKKVVVISAVIAASITVLTVACNGVAKEEKKKASLTNAELIKRGEYLVNAVGCDDCHSPKTMGPRGPEIIQELRFSGYPSTRPVQKADSNVVKQGWALFGPDLTSAVGPWGMSFAANISSDATGIGNWTEAQFIKAIREGKYKGLDNSRPLLPPMPWSSYKNFSDEDVKAIYAFLKSTQPVENIVPAAIPFSELKN